MTTTRLPFVWDYDLDEGTSARCSRVAGPWAGLDRNWAAVRLLEYASYPEIRRLLTLHDLVEGWPLWRGRIRSQTRRRGLDFLVDWLPRERPDLL